MEPKREALAKIKDGLGMETEKGGNFRKHIKPIPKVRILSLSEQS